jgi:hypothetical protein
MVIVVNVYCCIHGHRCERLLLYTWSSLWTSTVVYMVIDVNIYCCIHDVYNSRRSQRWPCIQQLTFTTMTIYTTVDVHNDDHVYNSRRAQRWPCIVSCCIHGLRCERLLLYTWSSLWASTIVYMVIVVNVYFCIHGHRCERLLLYTCSSLWTSTVV